MNSINGLIKISLISLVIGCFVSLLKYIHKTAGFKNKTFFLLGKCVGNKIIQQRIIQCKTCNHAQINAVNNFSTWQYLLLGHNPLSTQYRILLLYLVPTLISTTCIAQGEKKFTFHCCIMSFYPSGRNSALTIDGRFFLFPHLRVRPVIGVIGPRERR